MTTNIITEPDYVDDQNHTVLLVDIATNDIETLAFLCSNHDEEFNLYCYQEPMNNVEWLKSVALRADAIIVNTEINALSPLKDRLVDSPKAYYYGPKNFFNNNRKYNNVLDYFIQRANERKHSNHSL